MNLLKLMSQSDKTRLDSIGSIYASFAHMYQP